MKTFTFEGFKKAVGEVIELEAYMVSKGTKDALKAYWDAEAKLDGIMTFVIFATSDSDNWKKYQAYKWKALDGFRPW